MPDSRELISSTLGADVLNGGTFTFGYPAGRQAGDYVSGRDHKISFANTGVIAALAGLISFAFGASLITVTNSTGATFPAGTPFVAELDRFGYDANNVPQVADPYQMTTLWPVRHNLGIPATAVATLIAASQSIGAAGLALLNGSGTLVNGAIVFDVPRNVVGAWTGASVITITGTDVFGKVLRENSASGTAHTGKKAFKTITSIVSSAAITLATFGSGVVLGLNNFIPAVGYVLKELQDGVAAVAGTVVAGVDTVATALTGDIRGTYTPNSAPNGVLSFQLITLLGDPSGNVGRPQF